MDPGWLCSSAPSSSSSSSHTSTIFSCWWLGTWSKPLSPFPSPPASLPSLCCQSCTAAPLFLRWLIWRSLPNRDSIPVWIIISGFKSRVWPGKRRAVNPERSPSGDTLFERLGENKLFLPHVLLVCSIYSIPIGFTCSESTLRSRAWHPHVSPATRIHLRIFSVHLEEGKQALGASWGDLVSACFS